MNVIDVCSGIGTTAVAWHSLGWEHLCFAEIEKFPSAVLKHRWPDVPNEGDFTKIGSKYRGAADLLVGGTPCQSFSVAGLRGGLADDRGNLALEFLRLADRTRPRWVVWENVPGVLSSNGGRDFGSILGGLGQLGYGWAYRVLDAQHFGVPQRRRRVFVVGHLGDWRAAAAVLFERHSLQGDHPPSREARKGIAAGVEIGSPSGSTFQNTGHGWWNESDVAQSIRTPEGSGSLEANIVAGSLLSKANSSHDPTLETYVCGAVSSKWAKGTGEPAGDECYNLITHSLRADGFDASEDGPGRGTPIVPICWDEELNATSDQSGTIVRGGDGGRHAGVLAFSAKDHGADAADDVSPTLRAGGHSKSHANAGVMPAVCQVQWASGGGKLENPTMQALRAGAEHNYQFLRTGMAVRRLTPLECERLQGLPDRYTEVPYNGKPAADGPRYKAIGNGMAVPVVKWIGERISLVSKIGTPPKGDYL